jgi:glycosyltransferase involved in cell wall biosynthesis
VKKITLCIPVYNAEKTLARTLESLLAQDYPIHKIKIFDNHSTDKSQEISEKFAKQYSFIEFHVNEKNLGAEGNFTKCILAAEGDYCALVHSDDIYESNFVSKSIEVLEKYPEAIASFCGALEIDTDEVITGERFIPSELKHTDITLLGYDDLLRLIFKYSNFITCPSVMVRARAYTEVIKSWNGEVFKSSADLDVWLRLAMIGKLASITTPLIKYRIADVSHSYRIAKKRTTKHDLFLVLDHYKKINNDKLSKENLEDYDFLLLKDLALRNLNIIRNKKRDECFPEYISFNLFLILKKMGHSKWHFKMALSIIAIKIMTSLLSIIGWNKKCLKQ